MHKNRYYKSLGVADTWVNAKTMCELEGMILPILYSEEDRDGLLTFSECKQSSSCTICLFALET